MISRRSFIGGSLSVCVVAAASPASGAPTSRQFLDPQLLRRARAALEMNKGNLKHADLFAIADFSQPSSGKRFYLVETESGRATSHYVSHGRGSDPHHRGFLESFSNEPGSAASSAGAYFTGACYDGKYGRSMRLRGVDPTNNNAAARGIVVHAAPYAEPEMIMRMGKLGRSEGCFALPQASLELVLAHLGSGRLLYCDNLGGSLP